FFENYAPGLDWENPLISPLREPDLNAMPPTILVTADHDVLRFEGQAYAEKLKQAGNSVVFRNVPGVTHDFIRLHNLSTEADGEVAWIARSIKAHCMTDERYGSPAPSDRR